MIQELPITLPCGCKIARRIVDGERQLVMAPCSLDCENLEFALTEAIRQGKETRREPGRFGADGRARP